MKLKTLMSIKSVICLLFGIALVLIPVQMLNAYGIALDEGGALMARLLGAAFVLLGLWLGMARTVEDPEAQRAVATSVTVGDALGAAIMVYALVTGTGNLLGWVNVAIYALLAIGFGYVLFAAPEGRFAV